MAVKDAPPVINLLEEEEEEWPEAVAQNPEEAEQYVDKINHIFDHLSELIHEDKKDALGMMIRNFKKLVVKQWEMMGDVDIDVVLHTIKDPATVYLHQHLTRGGVKVFNPPDEIPTSPSLYVSYQKEQDEQKRLPSYQRYLTTHPRPMNICRLSVPTSAHWQKSLTGQHFTPL